jgi:hypothetical protein
LALFVVACTATPPRSDEQIIAERATARWKAVIAGDLTKAYEYVSPAGKLVVTEIGFKNSIRPGFHKGAELRGVKCESPEYCIATFEIEYEHTGRRVKTLLEERWVKQDSQWWFLLN